MTRYPTLINLHQYGSISVLIWFDVGEFMQGVGEAGDRGVTAIDRRKFMGRAAVLGVASVVAAPAMAAIKADDAGLRTLRARYELRNGTMITGLFAAPKGKTDLDVVLVMPANGASAEEVALRYADRGYLAIAPDLAKAQGRASAGAARETKVAEVMRALPGLKRMMNGNGRVVIVTA